VGIEHGLLKEIERDTLNAFALERVTQYQKLKIGNFEISTPFFSNDTALLFGQIMSDVGVSNEDIVNVFNVYNNNKVPFGWFRGKGTPEQITFAAKEIAKQWDLDLSKAANSEVITEFMKAAGLGIDCSGFVYQTLKYSFEKAGYTSVLDSVLRGIDVHEEENEYRIGVKNFTGKASRVIHPAETQPIDIIVIKDPTRGKYTHMALILKRDEDLMIAHSVIGQIPTGVHMSYLQIENDLPQFSFRPNLTERWEKLYKMGNLEFRRLNVF